MVELEVIARAGAALLFGALIGLERSYHGRAAGVRTYALVSLGAALVVAAVDLLAAQPVQTADVSRVIQGIVTGIGFLGAGVIVKEGFSVRGLTTAASIWVTAGVGVLVGMGDYLPAGAAALLTLITLSVLRKVEDRLPSQSYVQCHLSFPHDRKMDEERLRELIGTHGFNVTEMSYRLDAGAGIFQYRMVLWSADSLAPARLCACFEALPSVAEFRLSPSRD